MFKFFKQGIRKIEKKAQDARLAAQADQYAAGLEDKSCYCCC
jgi:hypothetical protein